MVSDIASQAYSTPRSKSRLVSRGPRAKASKAAAPKSEMALLPFSQSEIVGRETPRAAANCDWFCFRCFRNAMTDSGVHVMKPLDDM